MAPHIRSLDIAVVFLYLAGVAALGIYFSRKQTSTSRYFLGNRAFRGWVIGLSMMATAVSSVTFLAHPAAAYQLDWRLFFSHLPVPFVAVLVIVFVIPIYRQAGRTTAFEYLEERFGSLARLYGAMSFIVLQLLRVGSILYLVALATHVLTGVPVLWIVLIGGVFIAFYTIIGGIEAVIWTDVIQSVVLLFGGVLCLVMIIFSLPGGLSEIITTGVQYEKFSPGPMDFNLTERTFWTVVALGLLGWISDFVANQNVVQRYLAAASTREARKATAITAIVGMLTWAFFFLLGTSLFVYYHALPDEHVAGLQADQVLPYFVVTKLPTGAAGIIMAALLSAAMSSLDSSINAIATVGVTDIAKRYVVSGRNDEYYLRLARWLATLAGGLMIGGAVVFHFLPRETMFDLLLIVGSMFGGCMTGMFLMGMFTRRVNNTAVLVALAVAITANIYLMLNAVNFLPTAARLDIHSYWVSFVVNVVFIVVAYGWSVFKPVEQNLEGMTIWTTGETKNPPCRQ